jgi:hypothetical protein
MSDDTQVGQFNLVIGSITDKIMLDLAKAAGNADGAVRPIASSVGFPLANFNRHLQGAPQNIVLTRLLSLHSVARAKYYNWFY